ncbi:MAG TPA: hypothetical protein VFZ08_03525 [Terriglobia bacterium]|nr:hypothetical protein [Terriglobia bacterium]
MWRSEDRASWLKDEEGEAAQQERGLADYLEARPECGLGRMLADLALAPPDPFKSKARRRARKGFVITVLTLVAFVAWFAWFNLIR